MNDPRAEELERLLQVRRRDADRAELLAKAVDEWIGDDGGQRGDELDLQVEIFHQLLKLAELLRRP